VAKMLTQYPEALRKQFMNYFDQNEQLFSRGKNRLSYEMALDLTKEVLLKELNHLQTLQEPLYIEQLEARFELILNFQIGQKDIPMKFVGYVDRIDRVGNHYRVIDYKSGKVDAKEVKMSTMNDSLSNLSVPKHTLQLSLYCLFFKEKYGHLPQEAIIESLINRENHFALNIDQSSMLSAVPEILYDGLTTLVTELLDQSVSFTHYPTSKYCQFCS